MPDRLRLELSPLFLFIVLHQKGGSHDFLLLFVGLLFQLILDPLLLLLNVPLFLFVCLLLLLHDSDLLDVLLRL